MSRARTELDQTADGSGVGSMELLYGGSCAVPTGVAVCPECGAPLVAICESWITDTGRPAEVSVDCTADDDEGHCWWQSHWQATRDIVERWANVDAV